MTDTAITRLYVGSVVAVAGGVMPLDVVQAGLPISGSPAASVGG